MQCVLPGTSSPALIASGDEFHLGQSPPHWFGQFVNNATRVSIQPALTRNAPLFLYQSADRYPYHALPYRLYQS
ncbi:MAG: hypothetical protein FJ026_11825, partial [Chloroflexi bacterium]|nr:hypothetical protein [Chloroflexota bacterium]